MKTAVPYRWFDILKVGLTFVMVLVFYYLKDRLKVNILRHISIKKILLGRFLLHNVFLAQIYDLLAVYISGTSERL